MARWPGCRVSVGKTRFVLGYRTARNPGFLQVSTFQLEAQHPMVGGKGNRGDLPRVGGVLSHCTLSDYTPVARVTHALVCFNHIGNFLQLGLHHLKVSQLHSQN